MGYARNDRLPLLLEIIKACGGQVDGRTRFQKLVYLLQQKEKLRTGYDFFPYHYGPFSRQLDSDLRLLTALGFVKEEAQDVQGYVSYVYSLGDRGRKLLQSRQPRRAISQGISKLNGESTTALVSEAKRIAGMMP